MSKSFDNFQKKRLRSSYTSVIISISLVLFIVGILGLTLIKSTTISNYFKENIVVSIFFKDEVPKSKINKFRNELLSKKYTKSLHYISKERAAEIYKKDLGEDFINFLGYNPLKNGVNLYLKAEYVNPTEMDKLKNDLSKNDLIFDVSYDQPLVKQLTRNIKRIGFWSLILSGILGLFSIILINNSIRLAIHSKRFNIKTMQMVGATKGFIRRPFIWLGIKIGFISAFIAILGIGAVVYYVNKRVPTIALLNDYISLLYVAVGVFAISFIITWISTFFATQKVLNLHTNDLY